jgi:uncharacterized membrane protein
MAPEHHGAFGQDAFGRGAEKVARFFGTPQYLVGQTILVVAWIAINSVALTYHWDPYPFILLNLAFSTPGRLRGAADLACTDPAG